jgi:signal peptidase I
MDFIKKIVTFLWETFKIVIISLLIVIPIRYFVIQPFYVQGASMEPSFEDGEYLVIDELSYYFRTPERFEVIVFRSPPNPEQFYIKRIIGLSGETVEIRDGKVIISNGENPNGFILDESFYLETDSRTYGDVILTLGEDEYFVLGDNRNASSDSRSWGPLKEDFIVGRTWLRAYPFDKITFFSVD